MYKIKVTIRVTLSIKQKKNYFGEVYIFIKQEKT